MRSASSEKVRHLSMALLASLLLWPGTPQAAQVPVRFTEGMMRGFLSLSDAKGTRIGSGDFLQVPKGDEIRSRTLLTFKDGSVHDETGVFTQDKVFRLRRYRLIQKGPAFRDEMDITLDATTGSYEVKVKPRKTGHEKVLTGKLDLPADVYNGMVPTVAKNLPKGKGEIVHVVAFTPAPRILELDMVPSGDERVMVGDLKKSALHYVLKPKLGVMLKIPAAVLGKTPPDNHLWIVTADVPAFVKFEGPLYVEGPIWRVELDSPTFSK